jgi:hypothetical protein
MKRCAHGTSRYIGWFVLMLLLSANWCTVCAEDATQKTKPTVRFTSDLKVTVGQLSFTRPTLSVIDPTSNKAIRGRFIQRWGIKDADGNQVTTSLEEDGRVKFVDPTTGSKVSQLYGLESIGDKIGTFEVTVSLTPQDRYKDLYESAQAYYTVVVNPPTITVEYYNGSTWLNSTLPSSLQLYSYSIANQWGGTTKGSTTVPVPTAKLYYTLDNSTYDVTSDFTFTYQVSDGFTVNNNTIGTSLTTEGSGTLTITATPKDDNAKAKYGSKPIETSIGLKSSPRTEKIKTYVYFADHGQDALRCRNMTGTLSQSTYSPNITIEDEFGNDLTPEVMNGSSLSNLSASYEPLNAFNKYSTDPNDSVDDIGAGYKLIDEHTGGIQSIGVVAYNGALKVLAGVHNRPDDYIITVALNHQSWDPLFGDGGIYADPVAKPDKASMVNGQFYEINNKDQYSVNSNQYILRVHKRVPQISLSPDPNTISFAEGYTMTEFNRFEITGTYHDPYELNDPDEVRHALDDANGFTYWFFVPDDYKYDESKTEAENEEIAKQKGHALIRAYSAAMSDPQKVQQNRYEYVQVFNDDGFPKTDDNGNPVRQLLKGTYYASMYKWGNEKFTVTFYGVGLRAPLVYRINPWNSYSNNIGLSGSYSIKITSKEPTHFVIDPQSQVTGTGGTVPCPSITIEDQFGADVTSYFTVSRSKKSSGDYTLYDDGSVTSSTAGSYDVNVTGTLSSSSTQGKYYDNPADASYTAVFKQTSSGSVGAYEIIYDDNEFSTDATTQATSKMGKLHFIKAGEFYPGTISYGEVPGIDITFGSASEEEPWKVETSTQGTGVDNDNDKDANGISKKYIEGDAVTLDENTGLPTAGCFLKIDAITNGWLTIDARFLSNSESSIESEHYLLVDADTKEAQTHSEAEDKIMEYTFPKPLLAGHTYYLYTDDGDMKMHGLSYAPGFIDPVTESKPWTTPGAVDNNPVTRSSAFMNGYTGTLPTLAMHRQNEKVS